MTQDRAQIEEIKSKIDIVSIIGETVKLKHISGDTYKGALDAGSKSGESLNVDRGSQIWKDWANEGKKGDIFNWIAHREGLDIVNDFPHILKIAGDYAGVDVNVGHQPSDNKELLMLNTAIADFYHSQLTDEIRKHIHEQWGITDGTIDDMKIGFAPVNDSLVSETSGAFGPELLKSSGLMIDTGYGVKDFFHGRIMFPYWKGNHVVYFIGRQCDHTPKTKYESAKYKKQLVHSEKRTYISESVNNSYFYGENSLKGANDVLITEGVTDCIMAIQNGIPCISPVTTRFRHEDHTRMLALVKRLDTVYICNDSEDNESGMKGAIDTAKHLETSGVDVRLVQLPRNEGVNKVDVADFLRDATKEDFIHLMQDESVDVLTLLLNRLSIPRSSTAKLRACRSFVENELSGIDEAMRETFVLNEVAERFGYGKREIGKILKSTAKNVDDIDAHGSAAYFDEHGKLMVKTLSEFVMSIAHFKTLEDSKVVYAYSDGIYIANGEDVITKIVHAVLGDETKKNHVAEVVHYIQFTTLIPRDSVNNDITHINLKNGILDIRTCELRPHTPDEIYITQIPVEYNPSAECPVIMSFMDSTMQKPDIKPMLEFIGYCLIPDTKIERSVMLIGEGANGKTVLLSLISAFIGKNNKSSESLQMLEKDPYSAAELYGKLINVFPDLASGMIYDNHMFKMLTGNESDIRARKIYERPFKFKNTARLIFGANKVPPVPQNDFAYFRRWMLFEFKNKFIGADCDKDILDKLTVYTELSGLLNKVLPHLKHVLSCGDYSYDKTIEQVENIYRINSDPIAAFTEECVISSDDDCLKILMYQRFILWCETNKVKVVGENIFSRRLKKLGYTNKRQASGERSYVWESCNIVEEFKSVQVLENQKKFMDGFYRGREDHPSNRPSNDTHCLRVGEFKIDVDKKNKSYTCKQCGDFVDGWTDEPPDSEKIRPKIFLDSQNLDGFNKINDGSKKQSQSMRFNVSIVKDMIIQSNVLSEVIEKCERVGVTNVEQVINLLKVEGRILQPSANEIIWVN